MCRLPFGGIATHSDVSGAIRSEAERPGWESSSRRRFATRA
jgi:hypothetical protein